MIWLWLLAIPLNWLVPLVFSWGYAALGMWVMKDFVYGGRTKWALKFRLINKGEEGKSLDPWHARLWRDWWGLGLLGAMFYRDLAGKEDDKSVARGLAHEGEHTRHWLWLGLLFLVVYIGHSLLIFVFQPNKHAYLDNWSERLARAAAGQPVDITMSAWPSGPRDRWPWW